MCVFIYSLCRLYYDRSLASFKVSFPQSASQCFPFTLYYPLVSLRSSSRCLHLLPCLLIISILPSIFPSITCSRRQFLCKKLPTQLTFLLFIVFGMFIFSLTLLNTIYFSHDLSKLSSQSFSDATFQKLSRYFWSVSLLSKFQHH